MVRPGLVRGRGERKRGQAAERSPSGRAPRVDRVASQSIGSTSKQLSSGPGSFQAGEEWARGSWGAASAAWLDGLGVADPGALPIRRKWVPAGRPQPHRESRCHSLVVRAGPFAHRFAVEAGSRDLPRGVPARDRSSRARPMRHDRRSGGPLDPRASGGEGEKDQGCERSHLTQDTPPAARGNREGFLDGPCTSRRFRACAHARSFAPCTTRRPTRPPVRHRRSPAPRSHGAIPPKTTSTSRSPSASCSETAASQARSSAGIRETQEMLDFCGAHGITADVERHGLAQVRGSGRRRKVRRFGMRAGIPGSGRMGGKLGTLFERFGK